MSTLEPVHSGEALVVGDKGLAVADERGRQMQGVHRPQPEIRPQVDGVQDHPAVGWCRMDMRDATEQFRTTLDRVQVASFPLAARPHPRSSTRQHVQPLGPSGGAESLIQRGQG